MASEPTGRVNDANDQAAPAKPKRVAALPERLTKVMKAAAEFTRGKGGWDLVTGRAALVAGVGLLGLTLAIGYLFYPSGTDSTAKQEKTALSEVERPDMAAQGEGPIATTPSPVAANPVTPPASQEPVVIPDLEKSGREAVASAQPESTDPQVEDTAPGTPQGPQPKPAPMTEATASLGVRTTGAHLAADSRMPIPTPTVRPPAASVPETTSISETVPDKPTYAAPAPADIPEVTSESARAISKDPSTPLVPPSDTSLTSKSAGAASKPEPIAPARNDTAHQQARESSPDIQLVELETRLRQRGFQVERIDQGSLKLNLHKELSFGLDRAQVPPQSRRILALLASDLASDLASNPDLLLTVIGHTDASGPAAHNAALSLRRARAVAAFLVDNGLPARRIASVGRGETEPMTNDAVDGVPASLINRRIEIIVRGITGS